MRRRALLIHDEWTEAEIQSPYLVMEALEDGFNFSLSANTLQYRLMEDGEWVSLPAGTQLPMTLAKGRKVWLKGSNMTINSSSGIGTFTTTAKFNLSGNCFALLYGDNMDFDAAAPDYCFMKLFQGTGVVNISSSFLPCKTLGRYCYHQMFSSCPSLIKAPPIPAHTLAERCCQYMFERCNSLVEASKLPATTLGTGCYYAMFRICPNLVVASELPATILWSACYQEMYNGCTSLETAPDLLAANPQSYSYSGMFKGCSKLSYVKCLATGNFSNTSSAFSSWLDGVAATGTLVKSASSKLTAPEGWTVVEI